MAAYPKSSRPIHLGPTPAAWSCRRLPTLTITGRGLRRLAYGAVDDALEVWLAASSALHPPVDPYLIAAAAFARMARSGVTAAVHCHMPQRFDKLMDEAKAVARAAADIGIRLAFVVPMLDRNRLAYGGDDQILKSLSESDRAAIADRWLRPLPSAGEQIGMAEAIAEACQGPNTHVQFGPFGLEWASDDLMERIAENSARTGRRIHMHCQETMLQRAWMDHKYPDGFVRRLDRLGVLSPRLTLAHGAWLRPEECELLAERGVTIALNASSNLRLRSGIAPVADMVRAGVTLAIGTDALSLDDDDDALRELRLTYRLHAGHSFQPVLTPERLFRAAMQTGASVVTDRDDFGVVAPGGPADLVVLDYAAMAEDVIDDRTGEIEILLARATYAHVRSVVADGREIVRDGRVLGIDGPALTAELRAQAVANSAAGDEFAPLLHRYQDAVRAFYNAENRGGFE